MDAAKTEWIWFDLDDTLYDFRASSLVALKTVYREFGLDRFFPDMADWIDRYHYHNTRLWQLYNRGEVTQEQLRYRRFFMPLTDGGAIPDVADAMTWALDRRYLDVLGATGLTVAGAAEVLATLRHAGYRIGILSNGFTDVQSRKLHTCGFDRLVDCVVLSDEIGVNKPDRRLFDHALAKAGTTASRSLMVGDNPETDIAGALNAGWHALLYSPDSDSPSGNALTSLAELIKRLKIVISRTKCKKFRSEKPRIFLRPALNGGLGMGLHKASAPPQSDIQSRKR